MTKPRDVSELKLNFCHVLVCASCVFVLGLMVVKKGIMKGDKSGQRVEKYNYHYVY